MLPSRSASPFSSAVPSVYRRTAVATSMACSGPWTPADLVPLVTMPQTFVIGLSGRTMAHRAVGPAGHRMDRSGLDQVVEPQRLIRFARHFLAPFRWIGAAAAASAPADAAAGTECR